MKEPREILNEIIERIAIDVKELTDTPGKLPSEHALDLVRYSKAILDIVNDQDEILKRKRSVYDRMSIDELKALATDIVTPKEAPPTKE